MVDGIRLVYDSHLTARLDVFLANSNHNVTRSMVKNWIENGFVKVNNKPVKAGYNLKYGDEICALIPKPEPLELVPLCVCLPVIYEDDNIIAVNKPAGMVVHPAPGHSGDTLVNALLHHCKDLSTINGVLRPGIVHRLDKDTSGVIIAAKNDLAHKSLVSQFSNREIRKVYFGVVAGKIKRGIKHRIELPIGRHPIHRKKMSIQPQKGREAITEFEILKEFERYTLLKIIIKTGRTHQIRVHMAHIGNPILGDTEYGFIKLNRDFKDIVSRQMLHAFSLKINHPVTGEVMTFRAKIPDDMRRLLKTGGDDNVLQ